jgi:hypothetical protein
VDLRYLFIEKPPLTGLQQSHERENTAEKGLMQQIDPKGCASAQTEEADDGIPVIDPGK